MGASILDKTSPFSTPTKPSPKLTSAVEAKENRLASPSFTTQMRSSTKKNFMSPTISASSKTVAQRKKILAERNGGEGNEPTCAKFRRRRSSSCDLKQGTLDMGASTDSLTSSINETSSVEDGLDDPKLKPYDPVLNYCSPRPKFLLYKPDRRSEILRRYEMIDISSTSSESESSVEHEECLMKHNGEVTEEARDIVNHKDEVVSHHDETLEGSIKEINEKIEGDVEDCGKKYEDHNEVHKNSEHHQEVHEGTDHCKEDHKIIENHSKEDLVKDAEIVKVPNMNSQPEIGTIPTMLENDTNEIKIEALQAKDNAERRIQYTEIEDEDEDGGEFEEEGEEERCWSFKSLFKFWLVIVILGLFTFYLSSMNSISVVLNGDDRKVHSDLHRAPFIPDNATGYFFQDELDKIGLEEASHRIKGEIIMRERDHYTGGPLEDVHDLKIEGSDAKVFSEVVDAELVGVLQADKVETAVDEIDLQSAESVTEVVFQVAGAGNAGDIMGEELVHLEENTTPEPVIPSAEIETENHDALTEVVELQSEASKADRGEMFVLADANYHSEVTLDETAAFEDSTGDGLEVGEDWGVLHVTDSVGDGMRSNMEKVEEVTEVYSTPSLDYDGFWMRYSKETVKTAIAGVFSSLLFAVIGFLGFQQLIRTRKALQEEVDSKPEQDTIRRQDQVDFTYSSYSRPGAGSFNSGVGAPRVQLLGEYTVREKEVSSYSLRTDYVENYNDSSCSFSQRNLKMSPSQPTLSGFSSTTGTPPYGGEAPQRRIQKKEVPTSSIESPSYGSFTTEMMIRKKEETRGGEKIIVTPVRRSSRIHSKRTPGASQ